MKRFFFQNFQIVNHFQSDNHNDTFVSRDKKDQFCFLKRYYFPSPFIYSRTLIRENNPTRSILFHEQCTTVHHLPK